MKRFLSVLILLCSLAALGQSQDQANLFRPTATPPTPPCPFSRLFMNVSNQLALVDCNGVVTLVGGGGGGAGTVTSVGLSLPGIFSVSGSPVTTSGTLTATLANQTANTVFAGPTTGSAAAPTFRALVAADIPNLDAAKITTGTIATARLGSGTANSTTFLRGDQTWATPSFTVTGVWDAINPVRDHGCVGNGVADDTTCLTNAITAAANATTGKTIYLRTGVYKTTAKLSVPGGVAIVGDGREKTIIQGNANNTVLELLAGTGVFLSEGPTVKNLSVYGSSSGANQIGITVDDQVGPDLYINGAWIENVSVYQTGSHGVYFGNAFSSTFKRIYASAPVSGYPFLFNQLNMPGNTFEGLYAQDVNSTSPAGFRIRSGNITCWGCNGINNSSSNSWWAIIGDKVGVDGAVANRAAYLNCIDCNIESSRAGGILHYYNSRTDLSGTTLFSGDGGSAGTYIALKYEVDSAIFPPFFVKGVLSPSTTFANSPLSYYANSEVIHANDLPPVSIEGAVRQADGNLINTYYNTTNARSEAVYRVDGARPVTTITATASFTNPGATNYEANCAAPCTLTLPWPSWYTTNTDYIYVRNIGAGTLTINANSGGTVNSGGSYTLVTGESVVFMPHTASADYRLVGLQGAGAANRIPYFDGVQHLTSSANLTYDGTTVLNQKAGGNPYFAANDTTNGITTRFGPLAGAPDRAIIGTISNHPFGLYANNAERWTIGTAGHLTPGAATTYNIGSASLPINDVTIGGKLYWTGSTVFDFSGSGSPEGVVTAGIGSVYRRTNGTTGTTLYVKEAGTGNTGWSAVGGGGGSGLTNLNGLTAGTQSFAVGTSGTDFAVSSATSTHTFNLPDAGASARGVVTTGSQTIAGAKTFTSIVTANPGTTPTTGVLVDIATLGSAGTRDSNWLVMRGRSNDGSTRLSEWKQYVDVTANAGTSQLVFESRIDAASFTSRFTIGDDSAVSGGAFSGDSFTASGGSILDDDVNAATGFTVAGTAASGQYLRGNGTRAVFAALDGGDLSANTVTNAKLAQVATATFKGRTTSGTGDVEDLTATQATALLDVFTTSAKGLVPVASGGSTTTQFLRKDGTWAVPAGGGSSPPFADNTALVMNNTDNTKLIRFSLSGITTGTTRVITPPDTDGTLVYEANTASLSGKTLLSAVLSGSTISDDIIFSPGSALASEISSGNTFNLSAYDVDGVTYVDFLRLTSANSPSLEVLQSLTWADGVKQTFNPNGTNAGLNVGSQAGAPSSLANGDVWYDSTANKFKCRENGSTVDCISGGGGGLGDPGANGVVVRTALNTTTARTITAGTSNGLTVTDGNGVSGNPTVDFSTTNTSGLGFHLPGNGGLPFVTDSSSALAGSANEVRVALFYAPNRITVDRVGLNGVVDSASNNAGFGIYSSDGNTKICDSGAISTTSWSGANNYALSASCTFGPGYFYYAWTSNSTTPTVRSGAAVTNFFAPLNNGSGTVIGTAANSSSGGVLPSTLGALTDSNGLAIPIVRFYKN